MPDENIYNEFGVPAVINASGTKTRIGGSRIRPEAVDAMSRASQRFVRLSDLQAAASERIADVTGAEAGYVTNGAAGALVLSAAACIAGDDPGTMARLPDTEGVADEIIMPRTHRTGYDHALRTAGATIVDIGSNDRYLGTGSRDVEPWEYADAISEDTVAIGHIYKAYGTPPLSEVCEIAHEHDLPVIVDAAAELPPVENLSWFTEQGADLVAFSGGKGIRGPQTTGILAGRADLIESVAFQHLDMHAAEDVWEPPQELMDTSKIDGVPKQGIGRPLKVGKEELAGLLAALEAFREEDHEATSEEWLARAEEIATSLETVDGLDPSIDNSDISVAPEVDVQVEVGPAVATDLVGALRREEPRVFVGADALPDGRFTISPMCLTDAEAEYVVERIETNLRNGEGS
ncbi:aminotransferase class V-fold PLP-dependent enzyme [Halobacteria archaeon AArc-dxtr1]|nr:aminotransferase class V-fold PLP-dependent enzyme [Halobacteria archaeon AArc-dxtr1]